MFFLAVRRCCLSAVLFSIATIIHIVAMALLAAVVVGGFCQVAGAATPMVCTTGALPHGSKASPPDLVVTTGTCIVGLGTYYFHNINIFGGGKLQFADALTDFWAESILVQNNGSLTAGTTGAPIGTAGGHVTIHLWGPDQGGTATGPSGSGGKGIECLMSNGSGGYVTDPTCGVPSNIWSSNVMNMSNMNPASCTKVSQLGKDLLLPGNVDDCFYQYEPIVYDDGDPNAYFGYKVLALSYGGTINLFGKKGASYPTAVPLPAWYTGTSWVRLAQNIDSNPQVSPLLVVDRPVDWMAGDQIVVTSTDYLPGHSEQMTIQSVDSDRITIHVTRAFRFPHNGTKVDLAAKGVPADVGPQDDPNLPKGNGRLVDARAAVALLSRSIRIVSGCDSAGQDFPPAGMTCTNTPGNSYYFGGHTLVRQGFKSFQMQGVELYQLGQGGRIMHYPVHFHMARKTPQPAPGGKLPVTFLKDNSVWDSMTRWYTLHATQGAYLARNVGYLSIGHGYYLEDATETDNTLYSNIGIFVRAAVENPQNPRSVPGIFAGGYNNTTDDPVPYTSDVDHPTLFWITNGWNDFEYNFAAGANTCGVCYWFQPSGNSGFSRLQAWESYASEQKTYKSTCTSSITGQQYSCDNYASADTSPLKKFVGNTCSTAMESFLAISDTTACGGVVPQSPNLTAVPNPNIPPTPPDQTTLTTDADYYYPKIDPGGSRLATKCPPSGDCNPFVNNSPTLLKCSAGQEAGCMVTVLDHYRTSFNWSQQNFSAMWLRPQWYLVSNSALADIQIAGLTMITGGDYTASSVIPGYWGLARNDVFIGETQPTNYYASAAGPFNKYSEKADPTLVCAGNGGNGSYCLNENEGMTMLLSNFGVNQRLYNIYDGPAYQDSNAFLDITKTILEGCDQTSGANCSGSPNFWMYGLMAGIPMDTTQPSGMQCYMPNAAIAWKQPNGFFYPPAFHQNNLYFGNVDTRHFVILPLFTQTDYLHPFTFNQTAAQARYCTYNSAMFTGGWTDIDRQTELTDDDGSLTGLISQQVQNKGTHEVTVVNEDNFFNAPYQDVECGSDINTPPLSKAGTALSSPYEYVSTVMYPACASSCGNSWSVACTNQSCYGVPLYRLDVTGTENSSGATPFITMMGDSIAQRNTLTVNNGTYYVDTTVSQSSQAGAGYASFTSFVPNQTYWTFLLYAKPTTVQTYQVYIGTGLDPNLITNGTTIVSAIQVNKQNVPFTANTITWPSNWTKTYDPTTGNATVTMNLANLDFTATSSQCQPANFCTGTSSACNCALKTTDPTYTPSIFAQCQAACSTWSVKDIDCPDAGCYGFGVTMPSTFSNVAHVTPPAPSCFANNSNWNAGFLASPVNSGGCQYTTMPSSNFCSTGGRKQHSSAVADKQQ